MEQSPSLEAS